MTDLSVNSILCEAGGAAALRGKEKREDKGGGGLRRRGKKKGEKEGRNFGLSNSFWVCLVVVCFMSNILFANHLFFEGVSLVLLTQVILLMLKV